MKTLLSLLRFLSPHWLEITLSVLLGVAATGSGIALMGASAFIIATAALQPSIAVLQVAIVGVRFFGISRGVFRYLERLVSHELNFRLLARLRVWLFNALVPRAPGGLLSYRSGDILTRIVADIETLENFYVRAVAPPLVALVVMLGVGWFVGSAAIGFTALLLAGLLASGGLIPFLLYHRTRSANQQAVQARADLTATVVDGLQGSAELELFDQQRSFFKRLDQLAKRSSRIQVSLIRQQAGASAFNLMLTNLTLWGVVALGIICVNQGVIDGVTLAVLALVTLASFEAVLPLTAAAQSLEASLQAGRRLFEIADQPPFVAFPQQTVELPTSGEISFKQVSFRYPGKHDWVLKDINIRIANSEHIILLGASGAGKTTLLHLIQRFWDAETGEIRLGGVAIGNLAEKELRRQVCLMTQSTYLFDGSLRQNLLLAKPDASDGELWAALADARLIEWVKALPEGLETWLGERGQKMSGGERQRLAIARVLLRNAPIVLLDEPTSQLDAITAHGIRGTLFATLKDRTVVWITHEQTDLEWFDRKMTLEDGRLREGGLRN